MTSLITITPNPAPKGSDIQICYDFSQGATSPVTLTLDWDPSQQPSSVTLSAEDNCTTVSVNDNAKGLLISDDTGQSEDDGVTLT